MDASVVRSAWRVIRQDGTTAAEQMAIDLRLAEAAEPTLRFFQWARPACSLGFKQPAPVWIDAHALENVGIELIQRPTGGGLAVHGSDLSCSVVAPLHAGFGPRGLLQGLGDSVVRALAEFGVEARWVGDIPASARIAHCLTETSSYAVMVGRRKLCGFALRRLPESWLVQGSLLARELPDVFDRVMPAAVRRSFRTEAVSLEAAAGGAIDEAVLTARWQSNWERIWEASDEV